MNESGECNKQILLVSLCASRIDLKSASSDSESEIPSDSIDSIILLALVNDNWILLD